MEGKNWNPWISLKSDRLVLHTPRTKVHVLPRPGALSSAGLTQLFLGLSLNTVLSIPSAHPPFLNPASAELNTICFFPRTHLTMNLVCLIIFLPVLGPSQQVDYESWRVAEPTTPKSDCRRSGLATPSYLALVCWWLWAAGVWTVANEGRAFLWIPLTCLPPSDKLRHKWWYLLPILPSSISFTFIC